MVTAIIILLFFTALFIQQRYMPVWRVNKWDTSDLPLPNEKVVIVDIRDYRISCRENINDAYQIPLPYLKRHAGELPNKEIIIIASDLVERNLSIRTLRNKGFRVKGYYLASGQAEECYV